MREGDDAAKPNRIQHPAAAACQVRGYDRLAVARGQGMGRAEKKRKPERSSEHPGIGCRGSQKLLQTGRQLEG